MELQLNKRWPGVLALVVCGAFSLPALAADGDSERGVSPFDKYPECMKPDEMKPADREKCTVQNGPGRARVVPNTGTQAVDASGSSLGARAGSGDSQGQASPDSGATAPSGAAGSAVRR